MRGCAPPDANLNIQPIKNQMAFRPSSQLMIGSSLTWYEHFLNGWNMKFWKFEILEKCPGPISQIPANNGFWKRPRLVLQIAAKNGFGKSSNSQNPNFHFQPFIELFDIYGKMDLEKLIWMNPIWEFIAETFDLLWAKWFEDLFFRPQSQGGKFQIEQSPCFDCTINR